MSSYIHHFGISCGDLARSVDFYTEHLAMKELFRAEIAGETLPRIVGAPAGTSVSASLLVASGFDPNTMPATLELVQYGGIPPGRSRPGPATAGTPQLRFRVEGNDPGPTSDPDGVSLSVDTVQPAGAAAEHGSEMMAMRFVVADHARSAEFYRRHFGFEWRGNLDEEEAGERAFTGTRLGADAVELEFVSPVAGTSGSAFDGYSTPTGAGHVCICVDDQMATIAGLRAAGASSFSEPLSVVEGTTICYFRDPDEINIEVMQPGPGMGIAELIQEASN